MHKHEKELVVTILKQASERVGSAGCDDWDFPKDWTKEQRTELVDIFRDQNGELAQGAPLAMIVDAAGERRQPKELLGLDAAGERRQPKELLGLLSVPQEDLGADAKPARASLEASLDGDRERVVALVKHIVTSADDVTPRVGAGYRR